MDGGGPPAAAGIDPSDPRLGLLDALPDRVVRFRVADRTIRACNAAWAAAHGLTPATAEGLRLDDVLSAEERVGLERQLARLGTDGVTVVEDEPHPAPEDPERWLAWRDAHLPGPDGGDVVAVGRDVTDRHRAEVLLAASEARYRQMVDGSPDVIWHLGLDPEPHFVYLSPSFERLTGIPVEAATADLAVFTSTLSPETAAFFAAVTDGEPLPPRFDISLRRSDGTVAVHEAQVTLRADGLHGVSRDVTAVRALQAELAASEVRFRDLADRSPDIIWHLALEPRPHFVYMSPALETLTGVSLEAAYADPGAVIDLLDEETAKLFGVLLAGGAAAARRFDVGVRRPDGSTLVLETRAVPVPGGVQAVGRDVTELRAVQAELAAQALRDPLTGLANRRLLVEILDGALRRTQRSETRLAVAYLDLDRFKSVNDTHGHDAGDAVLVATARRLEASVRRADVVARIGGDEFVVVHEAGDLDALARRITVALDRPVDVGLGTVVHCPASVGVVAANLDEEPTAATVIAAADAAMYEVKRAARRAWEGGGVGADGSIILI